MWNKTNKSTRHRTRITVFTLCFAMMFLLNLVPALAVDGKSNVPTDTSEEQNILVLQSYHKGHEWSDQQGNAIIDTLVKSDRKVAVFLEYMDWKRYPDEQNLDLLHQRFQYKYADKTINLIMTTDDAALKFALEHRKELFSNAPIVFSGVFKQDAEPMLLGYEDVSGVYQVVDPEGTIQAAERMIPNLSKVYIIHDKSESGISTGNMMREAVLNSDSDLLQSDLSDFSMEQLIALVQVLDQESIVFLASYNSDINHVILPIQDLAESISLKSAVPVFTIEEGILGSGSIGGHLTSGSEHGKAAAEIGLRILGGEDADSIAKIDGLAVYWGFDYLQLERFDIPLDRLPEGSKVINKPFSFYENYKAFVLSNLLIIIVLFVLIFYLLYHLRYRTNVEKTLSEQKEAIYHLAYYSPVTGLANRINLKERLESIIQGDSERTERFALIYIDIDNFKEVNDTFGHTVGDQVLQAFAQRLNQLDGVVGNAFSLGGDEFIVLIQSQEKEQVEVIVNSLFEKMSKPFFSDDITFHITVSGGIVCYPGQGDSFIELLKNADTAMYRSKECGKGSFTFFDQSMSDEAIRKSKMQSHLRVAIEQGDFVLYYQPQLDAKNGKIWGYEALIRWNSSEFGFLPPLSFIKIAEDSHLIIPIGEWVLETACKFIKDIHDHFKTDCIVSVNISVTQLMQENFVDSVLRILEKIGLSAKYLELEITETVFLNSSKHVIEKLEKLKSFGIRVALDDFGTGYSSLSYLSQLPISTLKIDKTFINSFFDSQKNMVLTNTIIKMGHAMGMELVVEGVETPSQKELFSNLGCDRIQGNHIGEPAPDQVIFRNLMRKEKGRRTPS